MRPSEHGPGHHRTWRHLRRDQRRVFLTGALVLGLVAVAGTFGTDPVGAQAASTGSVSAFGSAAPYGSPTGVSLHSPVSGIAPAADGRGYWLLGADGGVFSYGSARFFGAAAGTGVLTPFVGIATPDGRGYWIAGNFGNVYPFGDAPDEGPGGVLPVAPVVGIVATPSADGYWLVAADGGVFSFGDARFSGSTGGLPLNAPVVGMAATPDGRGYWLVGADGGVFSFGDARFFGSTGGLPLNAPVVGMAATPDGRGYWLVAADGGVFAFGDARFFGSLGSEPPDRGTPVVAVAAAPDGRGYWLTTTDKALPPPSAVPSVLSQCNVPAAGPSVEPAGIVLACGDGNASLTHLTWSSWTPTTAAATGDYVHNLCLPDCADGSYATVPASIRLGYPVETSAGREFAMISYTDANPGGTASTVSTVVATSPG